MSTSSTEAAGPAHVAPVFAALGDETRLALIARLCEGGPLSIARLTTGSDLTRQAITKHLGVLARAGLVSGVRQGPGADLGTGSRAPERGARLAG